MKNVTEFFGRRDKVEELTTIKENILHGTLVFESLSPFLGYYNQFTEDNKPVYLYIGIDQPYSCIQLARAFQKIAKETSWDFEATKAVVQIKNRAYDVIRLRHLEGYKQVKEIQERFENEGIKMYKSSIKFHEENSHIHFEKIFYLDEIEDGIFIDKSEPYHAYLKVPYFAPFEDFVPINKNVKNNWLGNMYDAAPGSFCMNKQVIEMVRIYTKDFDIQFLKDLKNLYANKYNQ